MEEQKNTGRGMEILTNAKNYVKEFFDLRKSKENEELTVESIRNGVVFKGTNLWVLIFAIFIASLARDSLVQEWRVSSSLNLRPNLLPQG